ncbi:protein Spindly-like [Euwallacea fornicatus]|uniref:protein Spindly-like n=1 Tax=Euwallacea fornicatus TaxID=995702 RepID=UPI0033902FA9
MVEAMAEKVKQELEIIKQELYAKTQQLKVREAVLLSLEEDVGSKKAALGTLLSHANQQTLKAKERLVNKKLKNSSEIACLRSELEIYEQKCETILEKINILKKKKQAEQGKTITLKDNDPNDDLIEQLRNNIEKRQEDLLCLEELQRSLKMSIREKEKELGAYGENLLAEDEAIVGKLQLLEHLKDELQVAKNKIEELNTPLPLGSKGNSMFAEVDDRRVHLHEAINKIKNKYIFLQQQQHKNKELKSHLLTKSTDLFLSLEMEFKMQSTSESNTEDIKKEIHSLDEEIKNLGLQLKTKVKLIAKLPVGSNLENNYYQGVIDLKEQQIEKLEKDLCKLSKNVCDLADKSACLVCDLLNLQIEKLKLKYQIESK